MRIRDLIKVGRERLGESTTASLDAEVLISHVLGVEKEYLLMNPDEEISDDFEQLYYGYLAQVADGKPVAYITNEKEFYALNFYVDERVLIPRPETEFLVEYVIKYLSELSQQETDRRLKVVDVGTGSGNITISVAQHFQSQGLDFLDTFLALDISEDALEVARINAEQHAVESLVEFAQSDLLEAADTADFFDVIVANLPYVGEEKHRFVEENVEKYEPNVALFGGSDGLQLYKKMFEQIDMNLIEFGTMIGEFGFDQADDLAKLLTEYFGENWVIKPDLMGIDRFFIVNGNVR